MSGLDANPFPSTEMVTRATGVRVRARLSANENEFGPAPAVVEAIRAAATEANRYPDCEHFDLRTAVAADIGVDFAQVEVGTGIDGVLRDCCRVFTGRGGTVVTTEGTYATFAYFAHAVGARVATVPYDDSWRVDVAALARQAHELAADLVYLAEPDNPTGSTLGAAAIHALRRSLPDRTLLIVDGAYVEYQDPRERLVATDLTDRVLWLRTFSKAYGLAGMRVGYVVGDAELLRRLRQGAEYYAVGRVAQQAALAAWDAGAYLDWVVDQTRQGRAHYTDALTGLGLTTLTTQTNFVTVCCDEATPAAALRAALVAGGVMSRVVPLGGPSGLLRLTVGSPKQRAAALRLLAGRVAVPAAPPTVPRGR